MATATRIPPREVPPSWDTPGPTVVLLELDANEADAVIHALARAELTPHRAERREGLASGSLLAAGARVDVALRGVALRGGVRA